MSAHAQAVFCPIQQAGAKAELSRIQFEHGMLIAKQSCRRFPIPFNLS
jgi:hypothetical protein